MVWERHPVVRRPCGGKVHLRGELKPRRVGRDGPTQDRCGAAPTRGHDAGKDDDPAARLHVCCAPPGRRVSCRGVCSFTGEGRFMSPDLPERLT